MSASNESTRYECNVVCEAKYIKCTSNKSAGCVELLRVCREKCPIK